MQELPVLYDRSALEEKVAAQKRRVTFGFVSAGISVILLVALVLWNRFGRTGEQSMVWEMIQWLLVWTAVSGVVILGVNIVWLMRLRAGMRQVGEGLAFLMSRRGIHHANGALTWPEITSMAAAKGKAGHGHQLRIEGTDGSSVVFPLEGLGLLPGTIDAAARAYSSGHRAVDLSALKA